MPIHETKIVQSSPLRTDVSCSVLVPEFLPLLQSRLNSEGTVITLAGPAQANLLPESWGNALFQGEVSLRSVARFEELTNGFPEASRAYRFVRYQPI